MLLIADIIALFLLLTTIHVGNAVSFVMCSIGINTCIVYVMYSVIPICIPIYSSLATWNIYLLFSVLMILAIV